MTKANHKQVQINDTVLTESFAGDAVDRTAGVIRGVKVLGRVSRNGREYSDAALDDAMRLYENVNFDHNRKEPNAERKFIDSFGRLTNLQKKPDGVYADLEYKKSHPYAELVCESAERFPKNFGLSHNADGETVRRGGKTIVESIKSVKSVDIVCNPATSSGLFESFEDQPMKKSVTIKGLIESAKDAKKYTQARLQKLIEDGGDSAMMATPVDVMGPQDPAEEANPDDQVDDAFEALMLGIIRSDKSTADKLKDLQAAMELQDSLSGSGSSSSPTPPAGDTPVAESEALKKIQDGLTALVESQKKNDQRWLENDMKTMLIDAKREVKPERVKMLLESKDDARKQLIESWPEFQERTPINKPRVSTIMESEEKDFKDLPKGEAFVKQLARR